MAKQSKLIKMIEVVQGDATHIEVELSYNIGGMNYFTGDVLERGLKLSVRPVRKSVSECGKFSSTSYTAFSGISQHLLTLKRFNQKTLDTFNVDDETINKLVNIVKIKNHIETKE